MDKEDGRTLSRSALEERRKTIVRMKKAGKTEKEIMEATGTGHDSIYKVWKKYQTNGMSGLKVQQRGLHLGQLRHLTSEQEASLKKKIIDKHPEQLKLDFALWTREAVRQLIKQDCGFEMPIRTVGDYLKRWGFTPQRPVKFAFERKPVEVKEWLESSYPVISVRARAEGADIYWGDETALRSSDVRGRGFSPRGITPVVNATGKYQHISMVSAITNKGKVQWLFVEESVNAERFIEFLSRLIQSTDRKVFLILDNLRVHHCEPVTQWVEKRKEKIELFYLPAYSPDLNPDEHLNADIKQGVGSKTPVRTKENLRHAADIHMTFISNSPERIIRYFEDPAITYAAV